MFVEPAAVDDRVDHVRAGERRLVPGRRGNGPPVGDDREVRVDQRRHGGREGDLFGGQLKAALIGGILKLDAGGRIDVSSVSMSAQAWAVVGR